MIQTRYSTVVYIYIYWKCPFIVDFPINSMVIFHSYVNVYQRVYLVVYIYHLVLTNIAMENHHL